jgi:hypothetical protein
MKRSRLFDVYDTAPMKMNKFLWMQVVRLLIGGTHVPFIDKLNLVQVTQLPKNYMCDMYNAVYVRDYVLTAADVFPNRSCVVDPTAISFCDAMVLTATFPVCHPKQMVVCSAPGYTIDEKVPFFFNLRYEPVMNNKMFYQGQMSFPSNLRTLDVSHERSMLHLSHLPPSLEGLDCVSLGTLTPKNAHWPRSRDDYKVTFARDISPHSYHLPNNRVEILRTRQKYFSLHNHVVSRPGTINVIPPDKVEHLKRLKSMVVRGCAWINFEGLPALEDVSMPSNFWGYNYGCTMKFPALKAMRSNCYMCRVNSLGTLGDANCTKMECGIAPTGRSQPLVLDQAMETLYLPNHAYISQQIDTSAIRAFSFADIWKNHAGFNESIALASPKLEYLATKLTDKLAWMNDMVHLPAYLCIGTCASVAEDDMDRTCGFHADRLRSNTRTLCISSQCSRIDSFVWYFLKENTNSFELRLDFIVSRIDNAWNRFVTIPRPISLKKVVLHAGTSYCCVDLMDCDILEELIIFGNIFTRLPRTLIKVMAPGHALCIPANLGHVLCPIMGDESISTYKSMGGAWKSMNERENYTFGSHRRLKHLIVSRIVSCVSWLPIPQDAMDEYFPILAELYLTDVVDNPMHEYRAEETYPDHGYIAMIMPILIGMDQHPIDGIKSRWFQHEHPVDTNDRCQVSYARKHSYMKPLFDSVDVPSEDLENDLCRISIIVPKSVRYLELYSVFPATIRAYDTSLVSIKVWSPCIEMDISVPDMKHYPEISVFGPRQWMRSPTKITESMLMQSAPVYKDDHNISWHGGLVQDIYSFEGRNIDSLKHRTTIQDYLSSFNGMFPTDVECRRSEIHGLNIPSNAITDFQRRLKELCLRTIHSAEIASNPHRPWFGSAGCMFYLEAIPGQYGRRNITQEIYYTARRPMKRLCFDERDDRFDAYREPGFHYMRDYGYVRHRIVDEESLSYFEDDIYRTKNRFWSVDNKL